MVDLSKLHKEWCVRQWPSSHRHSHDHQSASWNSGKWTFCWFTDLPDESSLMYQMWHAQKMFDQRKKNTEFRTRLSSSAALFPNRTYTHRPFDRPRTWNLLVSTQILIHIKGTVKCVRISSFASAFIYNCELIIFPLGRYASSLTTNLMESENSTTSLRAFLRHSRGICLSHARLILSSDLCLVISAAYRIFNNVFMRRHIWWWSIGVCVCVWCKRKWIWNISSRRKWNRNE